jgi:hypothetical protein
MVPKRETFRSSFRERERERERERRGFVCTGIKDEENRKINREL